MATKRPSTHFKQMLLCEKERDILWINVVMHTVSTGQVTYAFPQLPAEVIYSFGVNHYILIPHVTAVTQKAEINPTYLTKT